MLPPPITIATSSPPERTSTSSRATLSTVGASRPYSCEPIKASPESFSRTRLKATLVRGNRVPGVVEELHSALGEVLAGRRGRLVGAVPRLLGENCLAVELLVQLALDDLLADVLGLREHFVGVREDLALGVDELLGDLVARAVGRPGERQVQREAARRRGIAALGAHERADLVRWTVHVRREHLAVTGFHPLRADDLNVLAELGRQIDALLFEIGGIAAAEHGLEHPLRVVEE